MRTRRTWLLTALLAWSAASTATEAIDVNQASEPQLDGLKGLGPATTRRILTEREKGPYKSWQDLLARVKGLGPGQAQSLSSQGLRVASEPYPAAKAQVGTERSTRKERP